MAEILLKVGTVGGADPKLYDDGDIVCAMHDEFIARTHAHLICFPRDGGGAKPVDGDGFRQDPLGLAQTYLTNTEQYRFTRVSPTEVERLTLATLATDTLPADPVWIAARLAYAKQATTKGAGKAIFGSSGAEIWYGGRSTITAAGIDTIWTAIETQTGLLRANHTLWPLTPTEKRHFCALAVDDYTNDERTTLESPEERTISRAVNILTSDAATAPNRWIVTFAEDVINTSPRIRVGDTLIDGGVTPRTAEVVRTAPQIIVRNITKPRTAGPNQARFEGLRTSRKRKRMIDWRALSLGVSQATVDDPNVEVDVRASAGTFTRSTVVTVKPDAPYVDP